MKLNNLTKKTMVSALALTLATSTFAFAADTTTSSNTSPVLTKPAISLDKAKSIAITDSGLNESDLAFLNIRLKPDFKNIDIEKIKERPMHNREEYKNLERNYEVEFRTFDNKEYDYTINSKTGVIMEKDNEIKKGHVNKNKDFKGQKNPNFKNKGMVRGSRCS